MKSIVWNLFFRYYVKAFVMLNSKISFFVILAMIFSVIPSKMYCKNMPSPTIYFQIYCIKNYEKNRDSRSLYKALAKNNSRKIIAIILDCIVFEKIAFTQKLYIAGIEGEGGERALEVSINAELSNDFCRIISRGVKNLSKKQRCIPTRR